MSLNQAELEQELKNLEQAVQALRNKIDYLTIQSEEEKKKPQQLSDLKGIWQGVDLSFTDIEKAEYQLPEGV